MNSKTNNTTHNFFRMWKFQPGNGKRSSKVFFQDLESKQRSGFSVRQRRSFCVYSIPFLRFSYYYQLTLFQNKTTLIKSSWIRYRKCLQCRTLPTLPHFLTSQARPSRHPCSMVPHRHVLLAFFYCITSRYNCVGGFI